MDEKFIRRQALPIDPAVRQRVRNYINAYAASSKGHPFANYGDDIKLEAYELCPIYRVTLRTQYDKRYVNSGQYPYRNTAIPNRKFFRVSDVDPWAFSFQTTDRFVDDRRAVEVDGSQYVETCKTCSGQGKYPCPVCEGVGSVPCSECGGTGKIYCKRCDHGYIKCSACNGAGTRQESYQESYTSRDYSGREFLGYRTVYKTVSCYSCSGKGENRCPSCGGAWEKTCTKCNHGRVTCSKCGGDKLITCSTCDGRGKLVQALYVNRHLYNNKDSVYLFDPRVGDVAEIFEQDSYRGYKVLDRTEERFERGFFRGESGLGAQLDTFLAKHDGDTSRGCRILFQQADIFRTDAWWVEYTYEGKRYNGVISDNHFYAGVSPISEYSEEVLEAADSYIGGTGTLKARKFVEQAEDLDVYDNRERVRKLRELVEKHLNTLYKLGTNLMFWLIALFVTPFLYNFYDRLNPVLRYAHFTNDPLWAPYNWLPAIQCVIFLGLLLLAKILMNEVDHSDDRHASVFGFVLAGMGLYLLVAVGILAVMLGLNYLGVSIVTTWVGYAIWRVLRFVLLAVVLIAALLVELVKWLWGLIF